MTRTTLLALASRVEAMRGPTCVVDVEIAIAVGCAGENSEGATNIRADPDEDGWLLFEMAGEPCECCNRAPPYTASLDAAMSLVPSGWKLRQMNFSAPCADDRSWHLNLHGGAEGQDCFVGRGATQSLALTAACLRALAVLEQDNG